MKFTDGYWMMRKGVQAAHPVEVLDCTVASGALVVHAPTTRIRHRGDLLKGPVVTIACDQWDRYKSTAWMQAWMAREAAMITLPAP